MPLCESTLSRPAGEFAFGMFTTWLWSHCRGAFWAHE